jgi:hypothetical protein
MLTTRDLLMGVLLPAAISASVVTIGWRATKRRLGQRDARLWAGPLAIGAGLGGAWLALFGREGIPPGDATGWLFVAIVPLSVLGAAEAWYRFPLQGRLASAAISVGALFWLLAAPLVAPDAPDRDAVLKAVALAAGLTVGWIVVMDQLGRRVSSARASAILLVAALGAAYVVGHSGSQRLAQIAAALAAAQVGILASSLWLPTCVAGRGVALVFGVLYGGLLVGGRLYAELNSAAGFALLVAPCSVWLVEPWRRRLHQWQTDVLQLALVAIVICAAAYLSGATGVGSE